MNFSFQLNPGEAILYRSQFSHTWYVLLWKIGVGVFEVMLFMLLSFTTFTNLADGLLVLFLAATPADALSRIVFQGLMPLLVLAWVAEETARIFTSQLILTNQRIWTRGSPYAWMDGKETPLSDIKSMSARRDAVFIRLKTTRKLQVQVFPDGRQIVKAFEQFTGKIESL